MLINVKVKPSSGKQEVVKVSENNYKIYLKCKPENNKANIELISLLEKYFKCKIKIVGGRTSSKKVIEVK